jgi:hypothetical protein
MEPVEAAAIGNELGPLLLEHLPDRLVGPLGMAVRLGPGDAFVHEPGVQLVVTLEPQPRREEALTHEPDLVLDLALLPDGRRRQYRSAIGEQCQFFSNMTDDTQRDR